jgi:hypothetical protein
MERNELVMNGLEQLSTELQMRKEGRKALVEVNLNYQGYFQLCGVTYDVMRQKWLTWFPTDVVPVTKDGFLRICAALLLKRIGFVRSSVLTEEPPRLGISRAVPIPAPIFVKLYSYGSVDIGGDRYVPTMTGIWKNVPGEDLSDVLYQRPDDALKLAYVTFVTGLTPKLVISAAMPSQPEGTMAMLFNVIESDEFNKPYALSDTATNADATLAAIAPDQVLAMRRRGGRFYELQEMLAFMFIHPFSSVEGPDMALLNFIEKSFRGAEVGS